MGAPSSPQSNNVAQKNTRASISSAFSEFKDSGSSKQSFPESPGRLLFHVKTSNSSKGGAGLDSSTARRRDDSNGSIAFTPLGLDFAGPDKSRGASSFGEAAMMSHFSLPQHGGNSVIHCKRNLTTESPACHQRLSNSLFRPNK